jgi:hypothetical protein
MDSALLTAAPRVQGLGTKMNAVTFEGRTIDLTAARQLMDDELCEAIHGTVDTEQEFLDAYVKAHEEKFGEAFVFG